ncbi:hypothetical protein D3C75_881850 [compost metagenome]
MLGIGIVKFDLRLDHTLTVPVKVDDVAILRVAVPIEVVGGVLVLIGPGQFIGPARIEVLDFTFEQARVDRVGPVYRRPWVGPWHSHLKVDVKVVTHWTEQASLANNVVAYPR